MIELSENISEYVRDTFGTEFHDKFEKNVYSEPTSYARIPGNAEEQKTILDKLTVYGIELEKVPNVPNAYIIKSGHNIIGKTLEHTLGQYYIQSLSSMIPPLVLNPDPEDVVMDLCAAPGSKTTQLADKMSRRGTVYANEPSTKRIKGLVHNIDKQSFVNIGVIQGKGENLSKLYPEFFSKILVDAPCSGLGIVQKKQEVSNWWTLNQAERLAEIQFKLLVSAVKMLEVGGEITYSTCTMTVEENELVLNKVLSLYPVELQEIELPIESIDGFVEYKGEKLNPEIKKARRIIPWVTKSEGFFVAKLKKVAETEAPKPLELKDRGFRLLSANNKEIKKYLQGTSEYYGIPMECFKEFQYLRKSNDIFIVDKDWIGEKLSAFSRIGTKFGSVSSRDNLILHTLAAQIFGKNITKNIYEITEASELKAYFEGAIINKNKDLKGQRVIKYQGSILGTAVCSQNGIKSQFPRSLRTAEIKLPIE